MDDEDFYPHAKMALLNDAFNLSKFQTECVVLKIPPLCIGPFINKCLSDKNLDLSEENLFRLGLLLTALYEDPQDDLNPNA